VPPSAVFDVLDRQDLAHLRRITEKIAAGSDE
jgi:hypothetical protein